MRKPAEVYPVSEYIQEELMERGWSMSRLAFEMGAGTEREMAVNQLTLELICGLPDDPRIAIGEETAAMLARALGVSPQFL